MRNRRTELSGGASLVPSHVLGLVPLHRPQDSGDLQEAWRPIRLLSLGVAELDFDHQVHSFGGNRKQLERESTSR